jgi:hypothetical protein
MRNYRALLLVIAALAVLVIVLLIMLFNPRHTPTTTTIVVSSSGLIGGTAKAGDILEFTTYQLIDPGYTVHFTGASPCSSKKTDLPVTPKQSASCTLVAPSGDEVSYLYVIKRNLSPGPHQQTVVPCKLCYFNNGSSAGSEVEQPQHAATAPSDNVTVSIGCAANGGNPGIYPQEADVLIDKVATVNWFPTGADFTVSFPNSPGSNPCTTNNFSNALPQCRIDPNAQTISYTYDWTLTCTGMPVTKGTGTVKLYADQAPK